MWEAIFGQSGAIVAQFFVILIFVLILTGVCYWLFRRYYGTALTSNGRSRVPRLGVIDSLSIDHRHRLVLIRRDNVEHLLLIGKTTDLVVEPSIVRNLPAGVRPRPNQGPRQQPQHRSAQASPPPTAAPPAAPSRPQVQNTPPAPAARPETTGISEPIPFPQNRRPQTRSLPQAAEPSDQPGREERVISASAQQHWSNPREVPAAVPVAAASGAAVASASAHFEEPTRPTRVEPAFSLADALDEIADVPVAARDDSYPAKNEQLAPVEPPGSPAQYSAETAEAIDEPPAEADEADAGTTTPDVVADNDVGQTAENQAEVDDGDRAATVSNLEQEMARLLGQITAKRDA